MKKRITALLYPSMCANTYNPRQAGPIQAVALTPVNDSYYADFTLEPPMVRVRKQNSSYLYLSSRDVQAVGERANNCTVAMTGQGLLLRKIKRLGLLFVRWKNNTPTINETNNLLRVFRRDLGIVQEVTLPTGFYDHPQALMTMLVAALTAQTGIVFTAVPPTATQSQKTWGITAATGVYFLWDSPAVKYGLSVFGLPTNIGPEFKGLPIPLADVAAYTLLTWTSAVVGPMNCVFSRYIDFCSDTLNKWTKNPNASTKFGANNIIVRLYLPEFDSYNSNPGTYATPIYQPLQRFAFASDNQPVTFTMNPDENISTVDIKVFDEYGRIYHIPPAGPFGGTLTSDPDFLADNQANYTGGFEWDIALYTEI